MNDRNAKIDEFLKFFRDIALQNPGFRLSHRNVYYELTRLGLPQEERDKEINQYFLNWIKHFRNNSNCNVFVSPYWQYFCQFISKDNLAKRANEHLKIYIPLDSAHIERGAKEIFEFLSSEGISHLSKIGSHVRFDDIVVRLINQEDVVKIVNFINNNEYIQEGLMSPNPFAFNVNGIPMAVDGSLSFNSTVASLVQFYINDKIENKMLNTVSVEDFYDFVQKYYNYVFSNAQGLEKLSRDFSENGSLSYDELVNYKNVFELLLNVSKNDFTFEKYIEHYTACADPYVQNAKIEQIKAIESGIVYEQESKVNYDNKSNDVVRRTNEMLLQVIDGMVEKYKDQYAVLDGINHYIMYGSENYITRYKNLRNIVVNSTFREDLSDILANNNIKFIDYAQYLLRERKKENITKKTNETNSYSTTEKTVILTIKEILEVMSNKYGARIAYDNLVEFVNTGDPYVITRDFGLREKVVNSTFRMDLNNIIKQRNVKLDDYLRIVSEVFVSCDEIYLEQAILETYSKYERKYQEGISRINGKEFVIGSLIKLVREGQYVGFTRDNEARANLEKNVPITEVINIIKKSININEISNTNIDELLEQYVEVILENNRNVNYNR